MRGILVVNEFLNSSKFNVIHEWLLKAAHRNDIRMQLKTNAEIIIDINEKPKERIADFILFWDKDVKLAYYLELLGYPVFNSSQAINLCDDKALTHLALMQENVAMPRTIIAPKTFENIGYTNYEFLIIVAKRIGFPMVVKESFGSFGQQVYLVHNYEELEERVKQCGSKPILFQEYIKSSYGRDLRLQVVGSKVIAAMYRYSINDDFRANITNGGKMISYEPTSQQQKIAVQCCEILGLDFAGVDILFGEGEQPLVCEVNSNAHFKNIFDCTGVNAADFIFEHIRTKLQ